MKLDSAVLHIGLGKTGTTSIQMFLGANRSRLLESGFAAYGPEDLEAFRQSDFEDTNRLVEGVKELNGRVRGRSARSVVWSMEALGTCQFASDRRRCEAFNARVAREFLGREDGVLFREPWPTSDEPYAPHSGLTTEKLVTILLHILLRLHQRMERLECALASRWAMK